MSGHLMNTYMRQPVTFVKGEGVWLWDEKGEKYLDALSGVAVNGLGHAHPKLVKAISEQAARLIHVSNIYQVAEQEALGDKLCELSGMDKVFFAIQAVRQTKHPSSWRAYTAIKKGLIILKLLSWSSHFMAVPWLRCQLPAITRCRQGLSHWSAGSFVCLMTT